MNNVTANAMLPTVSWAMHFGLSGNRTEDKLGLHTFTGPISNLKFSPSATHLWNQTTTKKAIKSLHFNALMDLFALHFQRDEISTEEKGTQLAAASPLDRCFSPIHHLDAFCEARTRTVDCFCAHFHDGNPIFTFSLSPFLP